MSSPGSIPRRHWLVFLCFLAVFVCYIDRINMSMAIIPMAENYDWDLRTQGMVLSSFFVGYLLLQIVGGRLADRFGGKRVLGAGVVLWSLFTMLTPPAASMGVGVLIATRVAMGLGEAVTFPSIYALYSRWIPLAERSRAFAVTNSGIAFGTVFALIAAPWIVSAFGWPWAFYLFGALGVVWFLVWHATTAARPQEHASITQAELSLIAPNRTATELASPQALPLRAYLKKLSVWAIIVAHFCHNWSLYVLLAWMPTFINKGLGVDYASVGWLTMLPYIGAFASLYVTGYIADRMIRGGMAVTKVRRICQTISFSGIAIALLIVGYVHETWLAIAVMTIGNCFSAFAVGGFVVNHMDIAPNHAGTLMGITNTAGTIPGIVGVSVSGLILQYTGSWILVFQLAAAVTLFGMVFYLLFSSGERTIE